MQLRSLETPWRCAVAAAVLALAACSTQQCRDMKGSGSALGGLLCGGEGDEAPEPAAPEANACSDFRLVMPGFFRLLDNHDPSLAGLRDAVKMIGTPVCLDDARSRRCSSDDDCDVGSCSPDGLCPCKNAFNPLGDLLVVTFRGLATISNDKAEPGAIGGRCLPIAAAMQLPPEQRNRMCELRRALDVLVQQDAARKILYDPAVQQVMTSLLHYIEGNGYASPHYDLFATLGAMAANPGVCDPADGYLFADRLISYLTPALSARMLGNLQTLLADPTTKQFLAQISNGTSAQGRAAVITLAQGLMPSILAAKSGGEAMKPVNDLLKQLVYDSSSYPQTFKDKVKAVMADVYTPADSSKNIAESGLLAADAGVFPLLQKQLSCLANVDPQGNMIGALYDVLALPQDKGGVDLATLVGAGKSLVSLDTTGQVQRLLLLVLRSLAADDDATEAGRALLAETLTPAVGQRLIPALDAMLQAQVLGEVLDLLDDLLYSCKAPAK